MSNKIGLILSFLFIVIFFVFGVDLISIQYIYTDLDTKAITMGYWISKTGSLDPSFIKYLENKYDVTFTCLDNCSPSFGDVVEYKVSKIYTPIILSKDPMDIAVKRTAVIGYYE